MARRKLTDEEKEIIRLKKDEERIAGNLAREKVDKSNFHDFGEPTRFFSVGEEVRIGSLDECIVQEVVENNKIYRVNCLRRQRSGDIKSDGWWRWTEIQKMERELNQDDDSRILKQDEDIRMNYYNTDLRSLLNDYYFFGIDMNADYQRGDVWELEDRVALIDSIYKNINIGSFAIIKHEYSVDGFGGEILDGKQRLTTLLMFYEDRFKYQGRTLSQMHFRDYHHFNQYAIMKCEAPPMTDEQRYRYFLKLNTQGKPQDKNHLEEVMNMWKKEVNKNEI